MTLWHIVSNNINSELQGFHGRMVKALSLGSKRHESDPLPHEAFGGENAKHDNSIGFFVDFSQGKQDPN